MREILKYFLSILIVLVPAKGNLIVFEKGFFKFKLPDFERKYEGFFEKGQNLSILFEKFNIPKEEFLVFKEKIERVFCLKNFKAGNKFEISLDKNNKIKYFKYEIDDYYILKAVKKREEVYAEKEKINYEKKYLLLEGKIESNLISAMEDLNLALEISEIFSSDIDFWTGLQKGDWFKVLVEGLYLEGKFKRYGKILYSEFFNVGYLYKAYYFEKEDGYFDEKGKNKLRAFLKTPLNFKRVSSSFSHSRYHPILKISRPHHGVDFVAPAGTPVSSIGDGRVEFAGFKGQYGKLVVIRHSNGWKSFYGHLSKFAEGIRVGAKVKQAEVIGYVGSTGLATGPHLHYELRAGERPVNPFKIKIPEGKEISKDLMDEFFSLKNYIDERIGNIKFNKKYIMEDFKWALKQEN